MDRDALAKVIEDSIDALPMALRLYPDTYADVIAEAVMPLMVAAYREGYNDHAHGQALAYAVYGIGNGGNDE